MKIFFFSKVPFVATLNLYLRMPDIMKKPENESVHPGPRKGPKSGHKLPIPPLMKVEWKTLVTDRVNTS